MPLSRLPHPMLRPLIERIWATDPQEISMNWERQAVLPTGQCHLAIRIGGAPYRIYDADDAADAATIAQGVIGGPRSRRYLKALGNAGPSVGALLKPGAASALFGLSAAELAERHTPLEDILSPGAGPLFDALAACDEAAGRLAVLERALLTLLAPRPVHLHPAIAQALGRLTPEARIAAVRADSNIARKRFDSLFRDAVGLSPKRYQRLIRFRSALTRLTQKADLAEIAYETGYADQSHFQHEFREIAGLTPRRYRALAPVSAYHLPLVE